MEKLTALKTDVDEATRKFEECQDAYATSMYDFINREQEFTDKIQRVWGVVWVWSWYRINQGIQFNIMYIYRREGEEGKGYTYIHIHIPTLLFSNLQI